MYTASRSAGLLACLLMILSGPVLTAQAQANQCAQELADADQYYNVGQFDQAITLITRCLNKSGLSETERQQAYRLMGLNYIAKDLRTEAMNAIRNLLRVVPNYQTDSVEDPPSFIQMVEEVRNNMATEQQSPIVRQQNPDNTPTSGGDLNIQTPPKKSGWVKWALIGGGLVAGGVAAAVLSGGGDPDPVVIQIDGPPDLP